MTFEECLRRANEELKNNGLVQRRAQKNLQRPERKTSRVKSFHKGELILKLRSDNGYPRVALCRGGKIKHIYIHQPVAETFIPNPESKREANHINGVKTDNRVSNLEWVTSSENQRHAVETGLKASGEDRSDSKLTNVALAQMFGVAHTTISAIQLGQIYKNAGGQVRTERLPDPKRIPDNVRNEIRRLHVRGSSEFGAVALAKKFGIGTSSIWRILHET